MKNIRGLVIVSIAFIASVALFMVADLTEKADNKNSNLKLDEQNTNLGAVEQVDGTTQDKNFFDESKIFSSDLDRKFLNKAEGVLVDGHTGYYIMGSRLSNSKGKVVYWEISECVKGFMLKNEPCEFKYNIVVRNVVSGKENVVYSYPKGQEKYLLPDPKVTGCGFGMEFPVAWSKNDLKIILKWDDPLGFSGCGVTHSYQTINPNGPLREPKSLIIPAWLEVLFTDSFSEAIYTEESSKTPVECSDMFEGNYGKIVMKNIETGIVKTLLEEPYSHYQLTGLSNNDKMLNYSIKKVEKIGECWDPADLGTDKILAL